MSIISRALTDTDGNVAAYDGAAEGEYLRISSGKIAGAALEPAGTTGQVQYNNAGALNGAANVTINGGGQLSHATADEHAVIAAPAAAASGYGMTYVGETAKRALLGFRGATGSAAFAQPQIFGRRVCVMVPSSSLWDQTGYWSFQGSGTATRQGFNTASTSRQKNSIRIRYTSTAAVDAAAGINMSQDNAWRGNATGLGGFFFWCRFGWDASPAGDCRVFVGLAAATGATTVTANPYSTAGNVNCIGIAKDSGDTNYQLITKDGTTGKQTVSLGVAPTNSDLIDLYLWAEPNGSAIHARVVDVNTGTDLYASSAISTNLPASNALMRCHILASTGPTSVTAIQFTPVMAYLETDL